MGRIDKVAHDLHSGTRSIDFVGRRRVSYAAAAVLAVLAVLVLSLQGVDGAADLAGGTEHRVSLPADRVDQETADAVRREVAAAGVPGAGSPVVTTLGEETIAVTTESMADERVAEVAAAIAAATGASPQDVTSDEIGAIVGRDGLQRTVIAVVAFAVVALLFVGAYFREWKAAVAALVALVLDLVLTMGVYVLAGFAVSVATVMGLVGVTVLSLYDKVVVLDRVRDHARALRESHRSYAEAANLALDQTLVRSVSTALVLLVPSAAVLALGAVQPGLGALGELALTVLVGTAAALTSSLFLATPLLVHLKQREPGVKEADRRAEVRRRQAAAAAERHTTAPAAAGARGAAPRGRGAVVPSAAAGRPQPSRKPQSASKAKQKPKPRPGSKSGSRPKSKKGRR